jgi:hypothetical protein
MIIGSGEVSIKGSLYISIKLTIKLNYKLWEERLLL